MILLHRQSMPATPIRKLTLVPAIRLGMVSLVFANLLVIGILSMLLLVHSNRVATKGYEIRQLEIEKNALLNKNQVLKMQAARAKSLEAIRDAINVNQLVEAKSVQYVDLSQLAFFDE